MEKLHKPVIIKGYESAFDAVTLKYSVIPISRTLIFSNLPITRTKSRSLSSVKHCNFTPDFSNQFAFPLEVRQVGILLYIYLKYMISVADLQPLSIAKINIFQQQARFCRQIYHSVKVHATLKRSLGGVSFRRITFRRIECVRVTSSNSQIQN